MTGLLRAIAEVGTVDALATSDFGHLVIAKTALLVTLALLAGACGAEPPIPRFMGGIISKGHPPNTAY